MGAFWAVWGALFLAMSWPAAGLLPRAWGITPAHTALAGTVFYYVAIVKAGARERRERQDARIPILGTLRLWRRALLRGLVFLIALGLIVLTVYAWLPQVDMRWQLIVLVAMIATEDLLDRKGTPSRAV
jgi:hypothetical protein